ncbi:MAG: hypothetical protein RIA69_08000 [Cyclobacteriaceae bacterium]
MKYNRTIQRVLAVLLVVFSLTIDLSAQGKLKKIDDSGGKPNWVNWSRGKDFKRLGKGRANKLKLDKNDEVYLFVAYARETANNGKTDLFSLDDTKRMATLNASLAIASIFKTEIDEALTNDVKISDDARQRLMTRTTKMTTAAKFSGFTKAGSYWEKMYDKENDKTYWDAFVLYSINRKTLEENLERAMNQLDIADKAGEVMSAIITASDDADDQDLVGEF